jgi:two-component sensor histidine kinase
MPGVAEGRPRGSYTLRAHLIAFGLATLLPVGALSAVLLARSAELERTQLEARLLQVANALADDVDREIERDLTVLRTLAALPSLTEGDWPNFYAQAKSAVGDKSYIILTDRSMRQVINTYVPYDAAPPLTGDPDTVRRMLESKKPVVSDLFVSLVTKRPVFNVSIPVFQNGDVRYILSLGQLADELQPILQAQLLGPDWVTAILDRQGAILARSRDHARLVGSTPPSFAADSEVESSNVRRAVNLDGDEVLRALARGRTSGWLVMVNIPLAMAEAPLRRSLWQWGGIASLAVILTAVLAWFFSRAMAQPMTYAAEAARALSRQEKIASARSSITEANTVVAALEQASEELAERSKHQALLLGELSHRVKNVLAVVQALVMRTLADERSTEDARHVLTERLQALSRAHDLLMRSDWKGAPFKDIVSAEVAPYGTRVEINGPELVIDGKLVQTFALVLHELATNAAKYGSLSNGIGTVAAFWTVDYAGEDGTFKFRWQEKGGPQVGAPTRKGFGSTLLDGALPADINSCSKFEPTGFVYELDAPVSVVAPAT